MIKSGISEVFNNLGWKDMMSPLTSGRVAGANTPTWATFKDNISGWKFSNTGTTEMWVTFHVDHDYATGTKLYPHMHWSPEDSTTGVVRWGFEYTHAKGHQQANGSVFRPSTTVYAEQNVASDSTDVHFVTETLESSAIDGTEMEPDTIILMRVFRDGGSSRDTFGADVFGWFADIHYQCDRVSTPNKAPNFYTSR